MRNSSRQNLLSKVLMVLTTAGSARASVQNFLGQRWLPKLLEFAPAGSKRRLALEILAISPHYFLVGSGDANVNLSRRACLELEHERMSASRAQLCDDALKQHLSGDQMICEFGCGPGYFARAAAKYAAEVLAVDVSCGAIACAKILNGCDNITYVVTDGTLKSLPGGSFDLVYSFAVIQHLTDDLFVAALQDFHRILKPGGKVVCHVATTADSQSHGGSVKTRYSLRMSWRSVESIRALIESAGFSAIECTPMNSITSVDDDVAADQLFVFKKND